MNIIGDELATTGRLRSYLTPTQSPATKAGGSMRTGMPRQPAFPALLGISGAGFAGLYLLFAVVPVLAATEGGRVGAGLATAVFMGATVTLQALTPRLMAVVRPHVLLGASLLLLGVPTVLYAVRPSLVPLLLITALRGAGFGLVTVVGTGLVSAYTAPERRGAALGVYGLTTSTAGIASPSIGLLLLHSSASQTTYWLGAAVPVAALGLLFVIRKASPGPVGAEDGPGRTLRVAWRDPRLRATAMLFFPCAVGYGAVYTFLPLLSADAPAGLLAFGAGFAAARLGFGRVADVVRPALLAVPLLGLAALGIVATATFPGGYGLIVSVAAAGAGMGGMATVSLVEVMSAVRTGESPLAAAMWNLTFDVGIASGGLALGVVAQLAGYRSVFVVSAVAIVLALAGAVAQLRRPPTRA
jgi:predicted MFS family arabinose efflux permease